VKFQLGPGFVQPTQLVFVPMLFLLGASAVPLLVAAAVMISRLPEILRRRAHPERLLVAVADAWYSVGPALLIALVAADEPARAAWSVCLLALGVQFAGDLVASTLREWVGAGIPPASLARVLALVSRRRPPGADRTAGRPGHEGVSVRVSARGAARRAPRADRT
jgi:hypothetical protein